MVHLSVHPSLSFPGDEKKQGVHSPDALKISRCSPCHKAHAHLEQIAESVCMAINPIYPFAKLEQST